MKEFEQYLVPVKSVKKILCIDERPRLEQIRAPHIPGAAYGLVDALKTILGISEEEAWQRLISAGISLDVHTDDHHNEEPGLGCGYAGKVQNKPVSVGVSQAVNAQERFEFARDNGGQVLHYTGPHNPTGAVINNYPDMTIDQTSAWNDGRGVFVYDRWAVLRYAALMNVDPGRLEHQVELEFRMTIKTLAGIDNVIVLNP
jgi:hypothetical protein